MVGARRRPRADIIPEPLSEPAGRPWEAQAGSARDSGGLRSRPWVAATR